MIQKPLYRYQKDGGGYTVTLVPPPEGKPYLPRWRLIAEEGKAITDGDQVVTVIDIMDEKDIEAWTDCEMPEVDLPEPPEL